MENTRVIDELFNFIRKHGQRAIAYSNDEKARLELLNLLEGADKYEVLLHEAIKGSSSISKILISPTKDLDERVISELGAVTEIINMGEEEDADNTSN